MFEDVLFRGKIVILLIILYCLDVFIICILRTDILSSPLDKMRNRVKGFWFNSKPLIVIWSICALIFYSLFRMALRNSSDTSEISISNEERRRRLYDKMARSLDENGAQFLQNGETSQSLSLSDLFQLKDGRVTPVLKAINPPVRANVLHLAPEHAIPIVEAVRSIFMPYFDKAIWFQNTTLYHFSMFHASHHVIPVSATEEEIESEAKAVENVAEELCPLSIILDRVVLTSTGVLLGCWQVISGTDPVVLRNRLRTALPRAPDKQLYDVAILHTSFARLLGRPENLPEGKRWMSELQLFHELVDELNSKIQGVKAKVTELWYVEEYDVLALALDGRMKARKFKLGCLRP